jgi:hypothetical protein
MVLQLTAVVRVIGHQVEVPMAGQVEGKHLLPPGLIAVERLVDGGPVLPKKLGARSAKSSNFVI